MSSLFKRAASAIKESPFVIPLYLVFWTMFIIGIGVFAEDLATSYFGYESFPTAKATPWIGYLVALIPSVGMIGFGYLYADDTRKSFAWWIAIALLLVDISTDLWFKVSGRSPLDVPLVWLLALGESVIIFTLGSEAMLVAAFGMIINLHRPFMRQIAEIWGAERDAGLADKIGQSFVYRDEGEDNGDDDPPGFPSHRFVNGGDPRRQQQSRPNLPADRPRP